MPRPAHRTVAALATRTARTALTALAALAALTLPACAARVPPAVQGEPILLVVDQNAGPQGRGAIFTIDPDDRTVRMFATSPLLLQPQDIMQQPDGSFLVLDYYGEGGTGKIFRFSADRAHCEELQIPSGLVDPYQFERAPDGSIWIVDKNADPLGLGGRGSGSGDSGSGGRGSGGRGGPEDDTGTLWRLAADFSALEVLATGPPLAAPSGLVFAGDEAFLMDADAFQVKPLRLENGEGAIFRVRRHPAKLETAVRFQRLVSPLGMYREPSGTFLIVDVNCDPVEVGRIHGAVYRVDPATGTTTLFAHHPDFRDPATCLAWRGALLVADPNADPLGLGPDGSKFHFGGNGRGGIYTVDLQTGTVTLFAASPQFVNPIRMRAARR